MFYDAYAGHPYVDMAGQRIGSYLVESKAPTVNRNARWRCRCAKCGRRPIIRGDQLRRMRAQPPEDCKLCERWEKAMSAA